MNIHNNICKNLSTTLNGLGKYEIAQKFTNLLYIKIIWERIICNILPHVKKYMKGFIKKGFVLEFSETPEIKNHLFEFNLVYRWHCLIPDTIRFNNKVYDASKMNQFNKESIFTIHEELNKNHPGKITYQNNPDFLSNIHISDNIYMDVDVAAIEQARAMGVPTFNAYREHIGLPRYKSFYELCDDIELTQDLSKLYSSVDDVEFYIGLHIEKAVFLGKKRGLGSDVMRIIIYTDASIGTINAYNEFTEWKTKNEFNLKENIFLEFLQLDVNKLFLEEQQMKIFNFLE
jgi:prostaglandin-endoperoxide synthase 2